MKKILCAFTIMCLASLGYAGTKLKGFEQAKDALSQGELLTFVVHFDQCNIKNPNKADDKLTLQATFRPEGVLLDDPKGMIFARGMTYSRKIDSLPKMGSVYQAYRYEFSKKNELHIIGNFLNPRTFKPRMKPVEVFCQLGHGFDVFA